LILAALRHTMCVTNQKTGGGALYSSKTNYFIGGSHIYVSTVNDSLVRLDHFHSFVDVKSLDLPDNSEETYLDLIQ